MEQTYIVRQGFTIRHRGEVFGSGATLPASHPAVEANRQKLTVYHDPNPQRRVEKTPERRSFAEFRPTYADPPILPEEELED